MPIELATPEEHNPTRGLPLTRCAADRDGDCNHHACPQNRDNEPARSGRSCPLWNHDEDDCYT